jgi:hypothetical protein
MSTDKVTELRQMYIWTVVLLSLIASYMRNLDITQLVVKQKLQAKQQAQLIDFFGKNEDGILCYTPGTSKKRNLQIHLCNYAVEKLTHIECGPLVK